MAEFEAQKTAAQAALEGIARVREYALARATLPATLTPEALAVRDEERRATLAALGEILNGLTESEVANLLLGGAKQASIVSLRPIRERGARSFSREHIHSLDPDCTETFYPESVDLALERGDKVPQVTLSLVHIMQLNQHFTQNPGLKDRPEYVTNMIKRKFPTGEGEPTWDFSVESRMVGSSKDYTIGAKKAVLPADLLVFPRLVPLFLSGVESLTAQTISAINALPDPNMQIAIARAARITGAMNESARAMRSALS